MRTEPHTPMTRIDACLVNHNTSPFAELALRSFAVMHAATPGDIDLNLVVVDNHSDDPGFAELTSTAEELSVRLIRSRWPAKDAHCNTHGDVLRDFVLEHPAADLFLLIDADVMFDEPDTIWTMVDELLASGDLWAVQARDRLIEERRGRGASLDIWAGTPQDLWVSIDAPPVHAIPGVHKPRCYPFCVLVRNSEVFKLVTETIGLSASVTISQDDRLAGFADTFGLASHVLATHGLRYELSSTTVTHFGGVTHLSIEAEVEPKRRECLQLLDGYRRLGHAPEPPRLW